MRKPSLLSLLTAVAGLGVIGYAMMNNKGILFFVFGVLLLFIAANIQSKEQTRRDRARQKEILSSGERKTWPQDFPQEDHRGIKKRNFVNGLCLTGSRLIYEGINPQMTIEALKIHDEVRFIRPDPKGHPYAVMVTDFKGDTAGWIPEKFNGVQEVALGLAAGSTVLGRVAKIEEDSRSRLSLYIDLAWYEKPSSS